MSWIDLVCRLPSLTVLLFALVICIAKGREHKKATVAACCGIGILWLQGLYSGLWGSAVVNMFDDRALAAKISTVLINAVSALGAALLVIAMLNGRRDSAKKAESSLEAAERGVSQSYTYGAWNLMIGGLLSSVGIAITVISYAKAANAPGGGTYVIAYGLIAAGAVQAVRGLVQVLR